jgi:hypothetical protein
MNAALAQEIADAVLYEGYILYPYRPSSVKNRQRWTFGGIYPRAYSETQSGSDAWSTQTQCLIAGDESTTLDVRVRFLHLQNRVVGALEHPLPNLQGEESEWQRVESLRVGDKTFHSWQESVEREVIAADLDVSTLVAQPQRIDFSFSASRATKPLCDETGDVIGVIVREQQAIAGAVEIGAEVAVDGLFKITVQTHNLTLLPDAEQKTRDEVLMQSLVSTHAILGVRGGEFVSLLDPPEGWHEIAESCRNIGVYPVLIGEENERDMMLASPIILYDYPQIAPESAGDLFDGTEIDEILTLRILTMTDEEKLEARQADERARAILDRSESLSSEQLMKLHGVMRGVRSLEEL